MAWSSQGLIAFANDFILDETSSVPKRASSISTLDAIQPEQSTHTSGTSPDMLPLPAAATDAPRKQRLTFHWPEKDNGLCPPLPLTPDITFLHPIVYLDFDPSGHLLLTIDEAGEGIIWSKEVLSFPLLRPL